jgi:hypothetical protein
VFVDHPNAESLIFVISLGILRVSKASKFALATYALNPFNCVPLMSKYSLGIQLVAQLS